MKCVVLPSAARRFNPAEDAVITDTAASSSGFVLAPRIQCAAKADAGAVITGCAHHYGSKCFVRDNVRDQNM